MAETFKSPHVIDVGWRVHRVTRASTNRAGRDPVAIGVNVLMLVTRMTRVVNVDIWNIWHMTFTGAMPGDQFWLGILGVVVHAAFDATNWGLVAKRYPRLAQRVAIPTRFIHAYTGEAPWGAR